MKYVSPVLNIVLLIAVTILYVLHFRSANSSESAMGAVTPGQPVQFPGEGIVFVNSDSLLNQYTYFKNKKVEFEAHQERVKNELHAEQEKLQQEADDYQQHAQTMSELERQQKEEQLMGKQQKLVQRKDELMAQLDEEQAKSTEDLYARIYNFLKEYNKDKKYIYVLGYQKGGGILYAREGLDITRQVVDGLNESYAKDPAK